MVREPFATAVALAREAQAAGLVVVQLAPLRRPEWQRDREPEFAVALYQPDGTRWAEGTDEDTETVRRIIAGWVARSPRPAPTPVLGEDGPQDRDEAVSMLAHYALATLWGESDFQPDGMGCCHVCCASCAALYYLERMGLLDVTVRAWPEGMRDSDMFVDDRVDREWLFRQWTGSPVQQQCGHRLDPPVEGWR